MSNVLDDLLSRDLKVVFCGTAAGMQSAQQKAYYARPGNQFWATLYQIGLTPRQLKPREYLTLLEYGIGLTDLAQHTSGMDKVLREGDYDVLGFRERIGRFKPRILAFNGKEAAKQVFDRTSVEYGKQRERIGSTQIYILPSTSGAARKHWDISHWQALSDALHP